MEKTMLDHYTMHMMILKSHTIEYRGEFHFSMRENDMKETIPEDKHVGEPYEGERYPYRAMPRRTSPEAATLSEEAWWLLDAPMPLDQSRWILLEILF